jgi:hypothetical protein
VKEMTAQNESWQAIVNGQIYKIDIGTLQQWAGEGRIKPTDRVKKGDLNWINASQAPGLREMFSSLSLVQPSISSSVAPSIASPVRTANSRYACKRCGSENTTSLPMAYSSGVSRGSV